MFFLRFFRFKPVLLNFFSLAAAHAATASVNASKFANTTGLHHPFKVISRSTRASFLTYYEELKKETATFADFSRTK